MLYDTLYYNGRDRLETDFGSAVVSADSQLRFTRDESQQNGRLRNWF